MTEQNIISREGLKKLKEELKDLIENQRPTVIEEIKEARGQGDLSENAEFDAARELQGKIEDRISEIERIIKESKVVSETKTKTKTVRIGSTVRVKIRTKEQDYTIVGALEANPFEGKISNVSPMGSALLNTKAGDTVIVNIDEAGVNKSLKATIVKIIK